MNASRSPKDARSTTAREGTRMYRWLLVLPFIWQVAAVPLVNDVAWSPWGIPFPMLWQMAGVVFASLVFAVVFELDKRHGVQEQEQAFLARLDERSTDA